jgi:hypothetical protein
MADPQAPQAAAPAAQPNIFDQIAQQQSAKPSAAAPATGQPAAPTGNIFDQIAANNGEVPKAPSTALPPQTSMFERLTPGHEQGNKYVATDANETPEQRQANQDKREQEHPIISGMGEGAGTLLSPILHPVDTVMGIVKSSPPGQAYQSIKNSIPVIHAYEESRKQGKGIGDSLSAANEVAKQHDETKQLFDSISAEYKKNPTMEVSKLLTEAVGTIGLIWAGGAGAGAGEVSAEEQLATRTAALREQAAAQGIKVPEAGTAQGAVEKTVANVAKKAGVPEGAAATEAPEVTVEKPTPPVKGTPPVKPDLNPKTGFNVAKDRAEYESAMKEFNESEATKQHAFTQQQAGYQEQVQAQKTFQSMPATEQKALQELAQQSAKAGKITGNLKVSPYKMLDNFDKLGTDGQASRFANPQAVRSALVSDVRWQTLKLAAAGLGATEIARQTGIPQVLVHLFIP